MDNMNQDNSEYCEVDAMGALIPSDKNTDLKEVEKNIQDRFNMGGEN